MIGSTSVWLVQKKIKHNFYYLISRQIFISSVRFQKGKERSQRCSVLQQIEDQWNDNIFFKPLKSSFTFASLIIQFSRMINNFQQNDDDQEANIKIINLQEKGFCEYLFSYPRVFSAVVATKTYIVKVFPSDKLEEYQKERNILTTLDHPNIIRSVGSSEQDVRQIFNRMTRQALVFPEERYGNFLRYINSFGSFSEKVSKFYLRQIVGALSYAKDHFGISHQNVNMENLLMKQDRDILICGWSNSMKLTPKPLPFVLAKLALQMVTGRDPFPHTEITSSPYYKLLTEKHIHKFWDQIGKTMSHKQKSFTISKEFKDFVSLLLLNKLTDLGDILKYLDQEQINLEDVQTELESKQTTNRKRASKEKKP